MFLDYLKLSVREREDLDYVIFARGYSFDELMIYWSIFKHFFSFIVNFLADATYTTLLSLIANAMITPFIILIYFTVTQIKLVK